MWNREELLAATQGTISGNIGNVSSVNIDSRQAQKDAVFIAINGEQHDGHDYVADVLNKGASAVIVSKIPVNISPDAPLILVKDTYQALLDMAKYARQRYVGKIIGVTGSVGKTGTKEALYHVLSHFGKTYATKGNLNNHFGLPLSLVNVSKAIQYCILEMGMNHAGEIAFLSRIAQPHVAIITTVAAAHLEFFANIEAIADAKAEIMEGIPPTGTIILNKDNPYFSRLEQHAIQKRIQHIETFGADVAATCRLQSYQSRAQGAAVQANIHDATLQYHLATSGKHWAMNSLSVLAVAYALGIDITHAAAQFSTFEEPAGRGKIQPLTLQDARDVVIIDDAYNANPASMQSAIEKLSELRNTHANLPRTIAVLGDMLELGATSTALHVALLDILLREKINKVFLTGTYMKALYDVLPESLKGGYAETAAQLAKILLPALQHGDYILLKGSRGSKMDIIKDVIIQHSARKG